MIRCPKCDYPNPDSYVECFKCNESLVSQPAPPPPQQPPTTNIQPPSQTPPPIQQQRPSPEITTSYEKYNESNPMPVTEGLPKNQYDFSNTDLWLTIPITGLNAIINAILIIRRPTNQYTSLFGYLTDGETDPEIIKIIKPRNLWEKFWGVLPSDRGVQVNYPPLQFTDGYGILWNLADSWGINSGNNRILWEYTGTMPNELPIPKQLLRITQDTY